MQSEMVANLSLIFEAQILPFQTTQVHLWSSVISVLYGHIKRSNVFLFFRPIHISRVKDKCQLSFPVLGYHSALFQVPNLFLLKYCNAPPFFGGGRVAWGHLFGGIQLTLHLRNDDSSSQDCFTQISFTVLFSTFSIVKG